MHEQVGSLCKATSLRDGGPSYCVCDDSRAKHDPANFEDLSK